MINGTHVVVYSDNAEADRAFFRDVLGFPSVDAGRGWLIFGLPAAEAAFHPAEGNARHEFYLMCDDVEDAVSKLGARGVECDPIGAVSWGRTTRLRLPGGGVLKLEGIKIGSRLWTSRPAVQRFLRRLAPGGAPAA